MALPVNINELINGHTVEWDRLEFKEGWNPEDVLHTMCAFANDVNNWGGGYIIIGIAEHEGTPVLPPTGLRKNQIDRIQKELIKISHHIDPFYSPVAEPVVFQGQHVFIIWVPGGLTRPYKASSSLSVKGQKQYYVCRGSATVIANHTEIKQLMDLAATVPFDDRLNHHASLDDLDLGIIRSFLQEIKSDLFEEAATMPFADLCKQMRLVSWNSEYIRPLNVALLFFSKQPDRFFRGAITEIVQFKDDSGTEFTETIFKGPIHHQAVAALNYIKNYIITEKVVKIPNQAKAHRYFNYPYIAVEESVINAYFHRSYEHGSTIEIGVHPDRIEILTFPGPIPPLDNDSFKQKRVPSRDYRNRRIGDFFKELELTEGRGTGIPKIYRELEKNGSPVPIFQTDKDRVHFLVTLPIHDGFLEVGVEAAKPKGKQAVHNRIDKILARQNPLSGRQLEIFELIKADNHITRKGMSEKLNINESAIQKHLEMLKKDGYIDRLGKTRGKWIILGKA